MKFFQQISNRQLYELCERLATSIDAGIAARAIWEHESSRGSTRHRMLMAKVRDKIAAGEPWHEAMASAGDYFPKIVLQIAKVGETSGKLDDGFRQLSAYYRNIEELWSSFRAFAIRPLLQLAAAVLILTLMLLAIGWVATMMKSKPIDVFGLGFGTAGNLCLLWSIVLGGTGFLTFLFIGVTSGWFGNQPLRIALRIPVLGTALRTIAISRLAWTLSMANDAGLDAIETAEMALESTQNLVYQETSKKIAEDLRRGKEMFYAFNATGVFPEDFLDALHTGEITGKIPETLLRFSRDYFERAKQLFQRVTVISGALLTLGMGLLMAFLIIFLYARIIFGTYYEAMNI